MPKELWKMNLILKQNRKAFSQNREFIKGVLRGAKGAQLKNPSKEGSEVRILSLTVCHIFLRNRIM